MVLEPSNSHNIIGSIIQPYQHAHHLLSYTRPSLIRKGLIRNETLKITALRYFLDLRADPWIKPVSYLWGLQWYWWNSWKLKEIRLEKTISKKTHPEGRQNKGRAGEEQENDPKQEIQGALGFIRLKKDLSCQSPLSELQLLPRVPMVFRNCFFFLPGNLKSHSDYCGNNVVAFWDG